MQKSLWLVWAVGALASIVALGWRAQIERKYRTVALVVDGNDVRTLQVLTGVPLDKVLSELKRAGASAVSVRAESLSDWERGGKVQVDDGAVSSSQPETLNQVRSAIERQFGYHLPEPKKFGGKWRLSLPSPNYLTVQVFVGFDTELAKSASKAGLAVVARLPNPIGLTESGLKFWMDEVKNVGAFAIVFDGEEVFGYRTMLKSVAEAIRQTNCQIGIIELVSQKGDRALATMIPERCVRVHSVSAKEIPNFSLPELVDRFVRAVNERNVRLCYIRVPSHLKGDPIETVRMYLSSLESELKRKGFAVGVPPSMSPVSMPLWLWVFVGLGVVTTGVAFLCLFVPLEVSQQWAVAIAGLVLILLLWFANPIWAGKLAALGVAIAAPVLAIWFGMKQTLQSGFRWKRAIAGIAACLALTLMCGVVEAATMFDYRFWLKISEFSGVKVSQLLPVLIITAMVFAQWMDTAELEFSKRYEIARENFRSLLETPVRWGQILGLLVLLLVAAYWLMRTGNEPGLGVPMWELKLRGAIEDFLGIRPRFKEFLLGHPFLVLAFFFLTGTHLEARIGQWLTVPAVIGLASIMNTFSHAHTPITLSIFRTLHGIWIGVLIGFFLVFALKWFSAARDRKGTIAAVAAKQSLSQKVSS